MRWRGEGDEAVVAMLTSHMHEACQEKKSVMLIINYRFFSYTRTHTHTDHALLPYT